MSKRLYFLAGEASGDEHGAALLRALRDSTPDFEFHGRGGPRMNAIAGAGFINWIESAAVVGLWEVAKRYGYFRAQFQSALAEIAQINPDAVVLIDYPGFNLRLARALRRKSPAIKIIYYISPQVWAWNRGRIRPMARFLDLMLCIFPFEAELYNQSGLRTIFVGHPMIENLAARRTGEERQRNLIGLFPGSRLREVRKNLPIMMNAAREIVMLDPQIQFEVAAASESLAVEIRELLRASPMQERFRIATSESAAVMQRATAGMVASGTATLEAAYFRLPFVLVYKVSWPTYFAARLLIKTEHLGMPNVLAGRSIVPEFIQHRARPDAISKAVWQLVRDSAARERMISEFDAIIEKLGERGASAKAAQAIVEELGRRP
ncbi:MAG TPA: lipid-A-disaccharide synthase [Chthoniobacterales bacterium]